MYNNVQIIHVEGKGVVGFVCIAGLFRENNADNAL